MLVDRQTWMSFYTLVWREVRRFLKVWSQTLLGPIISASLYILIFGISLSSVMGTQHDFPYIYFLIPGLVAMYALNNALQNSASSIMIGKFQNDLQDLRVIPLSPIFIMFAFIISSWIRAMFCGGAVFLIGQLFIYFQTGDWMPVLHPLSLFLFLSLTSIFFACLGIYAGFKASSFDQIHTVTVFLVLPLIYLGGVFYSQKVLHPFWQKVALFNPLVYMINGIRWGVLGVSDVSMTLAWSFGLGSMLLGLGIAWYGVKRGSYMRF